MAIITGTITQNGTAVGAGWRLVYGDSGSGIKTTDSNGEFTWDDVADGFLAVLTYVILDTSGSSRAGGSGKLIAAGGNFSFEAP
jgi:hypothetical protein|tara:strand:+ start:708 stop:959 length:252 start_codon:yes stop_codon:yes gene_type:complete